MNTVGTCTQSNLRFFSCRISRTEACTSFLWILSKSPRQADSYDMRFVKFGEMTIYVYQRATLSTVLFFHCTVPVSPPNAYNIVNTTETLLRIVCDCEATCVLTDDQFFQEIGAKKLEELTEGFGVSWFPTTRTRAGEMGGEVHSCDLERT